MNELMNEGKIHLTARLRTQNTHNVLKQEKDIPMCFPGAASVEEQREVTIPHTRTWSVDMKMRTQQLSMRSWAGVGVGVGEAGDNQGKEEQF